MKKFQFSLDHVRDYRDRLLDEETGKLQRLRAEQTRIEQLIAQLECCFANKLRKIFIQSAKKKRRLKGF